MNGMNELTNIIFQFQVQCSYFVQNIIYAHYFLNLNKNGTITRFYTYFFIC